MDIQIEKNAASLQSKQYYKLHFITGMRSKMFYKDLIFPFIFLLLNFYSDMNEGIWRIINGLSSLILINLMTNYILQYVNDKEKQIPQHFMKMGFQSSSYENSWIKILLSKALTICILFAVIGIIQEQYVMNIGGQGLVLGLFIVFPLAMVFQGLFLTLFINKNGGVVSNIYMLLYIVFSIIPIVIGGRESDSDGLNILLSIILPQYGLGMGINQRTDWEVSFLQPHSIKPEIYLLLIVCSAFLYLCLFLIIRICINKRKISQKLLQDSKLEQRDILHLQEEEQDKNNEKIKVLTAQIHMQQFNLYESQLLCLLGHRESGKSSLIKLLSGQSLNRSIQVEILGRQLKNSIPENDSLKYSIGVQGTDNLHIEYLTVKENLEFLCICKGIVLTQQAQVVQKAIEACYLENESDKQVQFLSQTSKRLLQIAFAVLGNAQILFLDHPTQNLDEFSQEIVLKIIKNLKQEGKAIVVSSDSVQEVQDLEADKIGITIQGKIKMLGNQKYLLSKFGIGYTLNVKLQNSKNGWEQIPEQIQDIIDQQGLKEQSTENTTDQVLKNKFVKQFQIAKFDQQGNNAIQNSLGKVLQELNKIKNISVSIQVSSLQDAFTNIGRIQQEAITHHHASPTHPESFKHLDTHQTGRNNNNNNNDQHQIQTNHHMTENALVAQKDNSSSSEPTLDLPQSSPVISFSSQLGAMIARKFKLTFRSKAWIAQVLFPILLIIAGAIIVGTAEITLVSYAFKAHGSDESFTYHHDVDPPLPDFDAQINYFGALLSIAVSFAMAYFVQPIVEEKERKVKFLMNSMGLKSASYWLGNFICDYMAMILYLITFIICAVTFNNADLLKEPIASWIFVLIPGFAACQMQSYSLSFLFQKTSQVQKYLPWLLILFQYIFPSLLVIPFEKENNTTKFAIVNTIFYIVLPVFGLKESGSCVVKQFKMDLISDPIKYEKNGAYYDGEVIYNPKYEFPDYTGGLTQPYQFFILFILQIVGFFFLTIYIERKSAQISLSAEQQKKQQDLGYQANEKDKNQIQEEKRIIENYEKNENIRVVKLGVRYASGQTGARDITFGVKNGQTLAIVGPKNSGKSSIFHSVVGMQPQSAGQVSISKGDLNLQNQISEIQDKTGVCPQFNALWSSLTVKEHLEIYGKIKGLQGQNLQKSVQCYIDAFKMNEFQNQKVKILSQNFKRRLCGALALIGGSEILFFDSVSEEMDIQGKIAFRNCLRSNMQGGNKSALVTCESIEEAEQVADKIGILINGKIIHLDNLEQLKQRFSEGMVIEVNTTKKEEQNVSYMLKKVFPEASYSSKANSYRDQLQKREQELSENTLLVDIQQKQNEKVWIVIQVPSEGFDYLSTFEFYEKLLELKTISQFSIKQNSLEEIYTALSLQQVQGVYQENRKK